VANSSAAMFLVTPSQVFFGVPSSKYRPASSSFKASGIRRNPPEPSPANTEGVQAAGCCGLRTTPEPPWPYGPAHCPSGTTIPVEPSEAFTSSLLKKVAQGLHIEFPVDR
jgi:hypothetical protein